MFSAGENACCLVWHLHCPILLLMAGNIFILLGISPFPSSFCPRLAKSEVQDLSGQVKTIKYQFIQFATKLFIDPPRALPDVQGSGGNEVMYATIRDTVQKFGSMRFAWIV